MAVYDKVVFHIARLQHDLVRIHNATRDQNHKAGIAALVDDTSAMLSHAKQLLLMTQDVGEPAPLHRNSWGFESLKVGEYIGADFAVAATLRASASAYGKRHGVQFSVRKQEDGTVRCYRTA